MGFKLADNGYYRRGNFGSSLVYSMFLMYSQNSINVCGSGRSFTHSWDNTAYFKKLCRPWICPRSHSSKIFAGLLFGWTLWMYWPNLKSVALPVPEIIAIEVLGASCEPQSWGRGDYRGSGMVPLERALVSSYRPSIVTFLHLYAFQRYCRFCAPAQHFLPPHL